MATTAATTGRNTKDLMETINRLTTQMAQRYMQIVRLSKLPTDPSSTSSLQNDASKAPDRNEVAVRALTMDIEVAALTTTAEELLTLTRRLKEIWLFGALDTLNQGKPAEATEEDATAVARMLAEALQREQEPVPQNG
ncbi:hypothetical protein FH972_023713 [Carpinus fangiana]|uniref:Mediator of RNA polymerase II transcription subunit 22 n=1 Tax=Carpinus fangiana TaxID=176857 RepID=A0A5N6KWD7_9ROSI|nr:hypothetical protein FH972_023713 [Carpinus fangiana]